MEKETFGTFFNSVKEHAENWFTARLNFYKLKGIRLFAKIAGNFTWFIISLFLFLLFSVFIGLTLGFWLSNVTGSNVLGFGIVTLLILLKIVLLYVFRKKLFINPMIRLMIKQVYGELQDEKEVKTDPYENK